MTRRYPPNLKRPKLGQADWRKLAPDPEPEPVQPRSIDCDRCGGQMPWCSTCQQYTRSCCIDFGTCMCS